METPISKQVLREQSRVRAEHRAPDVIQRASRQIIDQLATLTSFQAARRIGCYAATSIELPTEPLARSLWTAGTQLYFPRILSTTECTMTFVPVRAWDELVAGPYGLLAPPEATAPDGAPLDCLLVPAVAYDVTGNRLGRGKGYYDRWLASYSGLRIGLAFDDQVLEQIPHESRDQRVDIIVTEARIIACQQRR